MEKLEVRLVRTAILNLFSSISTAFPGDSTTITSLYDGQSSSSTVGHCNARDVNLHEFMDGDPLRPRTFISNPTVSAIVHAAVGAERRQNTNATTQYAAGPVGEPVPYHSERRDTADDGYNARHPLHLSEAVADAFTEPTEPEDVESTSSSFLPQSVPQTTLPNFSELGLVHLGAREYSPRRNESPGGNGSDGFRKPTGSISRNPSHSPAGQTRIVGRDMDVIEMPSTRAASVISGSGSAGGSYAIADNPEENAHVTFRYQHVEHDDGSHLIVGREGKLTRCEDEVSNPYLFLFRKYLSLVVADSYAWCGPGLWGFDCYRRRP